MILENVHVARTGLSEASKKRVKAGRLLLASKGCAEVALAAGVARQTVYTWKRLLDEGGIDTPLFLIALGFEMLFAALSEIVLRRSHPVRTA